MLNVLLSIANLINYRKWKVKGRKYWGRKSIKQLWYRKSVLCVDTSAEKLEHRKCLTLYRNRQSTETNIYANFNKNRILNAVNWSTNIIMKEIECRLLWNSNRIWCFTAPMGTNSSWCCFDKRFCHSTFPDNDFPSENTQPNGCFMINSIFAASRVNSAIFFS